MNFRYVASISTLTFVLQFGFLLFAHRRDRTGLMVKETGNLTLDCFDFSRACTSVHSKVIDDGLIIETFGAILEELSTIVGPEI